MTVKRMDNVGIVVVDIDDTLVRLGKRGAKLVGEVASSNRSVRLKRETGLLRSAFSLFRPKAAPIG